MEKLTLETFIDKTRRFIGWMLTAPHDSGYYSDHDPLASPIRPVTDLPTHEFQPAELRLLLDEEA